MVLEFFDDDDGFTQLRWIAVEQMKTMEELVREFFEIMADPSQRVCTKHYYMQNGVILYGYTPSKSKEFHVDFRVRTHVMCPLGKGYQWDMPVLEVMVLNWLEELPVDAVPSIATQNNKFEVWDNKEKRYLETFEAVLLGRDGKLYLPHQPNNWISDESGRYEVHWNGGVPCVQK